MPITLYNSRSTPKSLPPLRNAYSRLTLFPRLLRHTAAVGTAKPHEAASTLPRTWSRQLSEIAAAFGAALTRIGSRGQDTVDVSVRSTADGSTTSGGDPKRIRKAVSRAVSSLGSALGSTFAPKADVEQRAVRTCAVNSAVIRAAVLMMFPPRRRMALGVLKELVEPRQYEQLVKYAPESQHPRKPVQTLQHTRRPLSPSASNCARCTRDASAFGLL